jgi:hypothetical protein
MNSGDCVPGDQQTGRVPFAEQVRTMRAVHAKLARSIRAVFAMAVMPAVPVRDRAACGTSGDCGTGKLLPIAAIIRMFKLSNVNII